jgi:hypothetical protein
MSYVLAAFLAFWVTGLQDVPPKAGPFRARPIASVSREASRTPGTIRDDVKENPVLRQNSIGVVCLETSAETLPFSCPLEATKAGKRRQRAAQGESPKSLDIPSEDASSGNAEQGSAKRG